MLRLQVPHTFGTTDHDPIYTLGTVAALTDVGKTYRIEWNDGTLECAPDQYIRVLVNGVTVFEQTEAGDGVDLHPTVATIGGYYLGFAGLFGEATNVRIYADDDCDAEPETGHRHRQRDALFLSQHAGAGDRSRIRSACCNRRPTSARVAGRLRRSRTSMALGGCWAAGMAA